MSDIAVEPKVTIVTVTYNAQDYIEETINSVINQTFTDYEYILVDGKSSDQTCSVIEKYKDHITTFISEPDKGLYDAMNKAIKLAKGEWIAFINAGDVYVDDSVLERVFNMYSHDDSDFIYGSHIWVNGDQQALVPVRPLDLMWQRICFCHQSLFSRTSLMKEKPFDLSYKIVSDYENYFSRYSEGKKFLNVDFPVCKFLAGGVSDINFMARTLERWSVVKKYKPLFAKWHLYYISLIYQNYKKKINRYGFK